ncbi:MAG: hypothetical protein ACR2NQ_06205 [Thermodesulfobacteriota bacterium]
MANKASIKKIDNIKMELKNNGIEIEVLETTQKGQKHLGDLVVKKSGLVWCNGRTTPAKGKPIDWPTFIGYMNNRNVSGGSKNKKKKS